MGHKKKKKSAIPDTFHISDPQYNFMNTVNGPITSDNWPWGSLQHLRKAQTQYNNIKKNTTSGIG